MKLVSNSYQCCVSFVAVGVTIVTLLAGLEWLECPDKMEQLFTVWTLGQFQCEECGHVKLTTGQLD